ncbi:MAG: CAP domain-containing protein [Rudaea sp.]
MKHKIVTFLTLLAMTALLLEGAASSRGATGLSVQAARVPAQLDASPAEQLSIATAKETSSPTSSPTDTATTIPSLTDTPTATPSNTPTPLPTNPPTSTPAHTIPPTRTRTAQAPLPTRTPTRVPPKPVLQIDAADQRVLDLTNAVRAGQGLRPLRWNANLIASAGWFVGDMSFHGGSLSHTDSAGRDAATRMLAFGYRWVWYAENIARGYDSPDSVFAGWMASEGHRANILCPNVTEIGIAHAGGGTEEYWAQDFGAR